MLLLLFSILLNVFFSATGNGYSDWFFKRSEYNINIPATATTTGSPVLTTELIITDHDGSDIELYGYVSESYSNWNIPQDQFDITVAGHKVSSVFTLSNASGASQCSIGGRTYTSLAVQIYLRNVTGDFTAVQVASRNQFSRRYYEYFHFTVNQGSI